MKIQWDSKSTSKCFYVSNGVCQGGVLSPFLFAIYLDDLLSELSLSGVGCYWCWWFAGAFCFADDIVLLGLCASALRTMLAICTSFASSHGLLFNTEKTQLILFRGMLTTYLMIYTYSYIAFCDCTVPRHWYSVDLCMLSTIITLP